VTLRRQEDAIRSAMAAINGRGNGDGAAQL
jgi:hypothetical protein